ncbi:aminotransferase class I/II-fold pyridoxal phosphate-dependent enzyme [Macrococcus brunensis]|uniref:aminotransferase class I/II-fold pyridoxal phosphate-dependent enzyme n=1 Tax=Macrococcus brunensis TaxID=198483 RepID=UPI001EF03922|nr:aminotransferase class I/II-fold pyridoxal phosphate-dependent enzyme [Macrococcus brunensis]ULG74539.1 aminotransferase class I/II-fold pyridoxal phosphate-dependent enzyme [Macrococcus brunensis]
MEHRFNERVTDLKIPGTRQFSNKVSEYDNGINLTLGQSGFDAPDFIRQAMTKAIDDGKLRYTHNKGLIELRRAIADYTKKRFSVSYDPETEIIVTNGGSEAIDSVFRAIVAPGDEVIIPAPAYAGYEPIIHLLGAKAVYVDTTKTHFVPTKAAIEAAITDRTKAVLFNYPSNPTGTTMTQAQIAELVSLLKDKDILIITDEIYSENVYSEKHHSFMEFPEVRDQLFVINGLSKSHAITGARIGYILAPPFATEQVTKVHLYNTICAATPSQYGAIAALTHPETPAMLEKMNRAYIERRDYLYKRLTEMGLPVELPTGAFYILPDISAYNKDSFQFATDLLEAEQVAVVPGAAFTPYGEGHIRLSFASTMEEIEEGCARLERFLRNCITKSN